MNDLFEMCFELEDIESIEESGYKNVYDITVDGDHSFILANGVVSHNSALGGLTPVLGRKECGYYTLKGKPLNSYSAPQSKFTANKELAGTSSEAGLFQIIKDGATITDKPDGDFYELEVSGKHYIVNENDSIIIDGKSVDVKSLIG